MIDQDTGEILDSGGLADDAQSEFERRDDAQIMAAINGAFIDQFVYAFEQDGRPQLGLSVHGALEVARAMGSIEIGMPVVTTTDDEVSVEIPATDLSRRVTVVGSATELRQKYIKARDKWFDDPFARTKAVNKAQRNAILHLIPEIVKAGMIEQFRARDRGQDRQRPARQQRSSPSGTSKTALPAREDQLQRMNEHIKAGTLTVEQLNALVKAKFSQQSARGLTEAQADRLLGLLDAGKVV